MSSFLFVFNLIIVHHLPPYAGQFYWCCVSLSLSVSLTKDQESMKWLSFVVQTCGHTRPTQNAPSLFTDRQSLYLSIPLGTGHSSILQLLLQLLPLNINPSTRHTHTEKKKKIKRKKTFNYVIGRGTVVTATAAVVCVSSELVGQSFLSAADPLSLSRHTDTASCHPIRTRANYSKNPGQMFNLTLCCTISKVSVSVCMCVLWRRLGGQTLHCFPNRV